MSGGAATKDRSYDRRLSQLERELRDLRNAGERQTRRLTGMSWPRDVRLAITVTDGNGQYPATDANTFNIELLDSYFPASAGNRTPTHQQRGERLVGHVLGGGYLAQGTACFALRSRGLGPAGSGEWWIWPARARSGIAKLTAALSAGSTSSTTSASGVLQRRNTSSGALEPTGEVITVRSWYATAFAVNRFLGVAQDDMGDWWITSADCT
jgi:hypothetical protein